MTPNEMVNGLMTGMGAIAETAYMYYTNLVKAGFKEKQAIELTKAFTNALWAQISNKGGGE